MTDPSLIDENGEMMRGGAPGGSTSHDQQSYHGESAIVDSGCTTRFAQANVIGLWG